MPVPVLQSLARGGSFDDDGASYASVVQGWLAWAPTSPDVGIQTRRVATRPRAPTNAAQGPKSPRGTTAMPSGRR